MIKSAFQKYILQNINSNEVKYIFCKYIFEILFYI